jgi:hypothetical protein
MEQVDYPEGVKSHHVIVTTPARASAKISTLYPKNPAWRIVEMKYLGPFPGAPMRRKMRAPGELATPGR